MKRVFFRIVDAQNYHINFRKSLARLFQHLKTAQAGHREIQQHNVRLKLFNQLQCLQAVASLADDLDFIDPLQERTNSRANKRVIICQYHLDWFHLALPFRRDGAKFPSGKNGEFTRSSIASVRSKKLLCVNSREKKYAVLFARRCRMSLGVSCRASRELRFWALPGI